MKEFRILEERKIKDSTYKLFEHEKTKARILAVENDDPNNFFSIGFKTPPLRSTGVTHIIEHSVLNGSKKYKTKEPFMDMLKSSLQTFLNAITFSDKTVYPIGSKNEEDFHNLMDVYLDAVFNPRAMEDERIFRQEGIRLDAKENSFQYNGVVFNEMKGVLSDPENQVMYNIGKELFKNTPYSLESGGDPYEIIDLTYNDFKNYYKKHYHPSNSYIYLYGNMDLNRSLDHINNYLNQYEYMKIEDTLNMKEDSIEKTIEMSFNSSEESLEKKNFMSMSFILGDSQDPINRFMGDILADILVEQEGSALKKALGKKNIGEDYFAYNSSDRQTSFSIIAKNTGYNIDEFKNIIIEELEKIVEKGLDKNYLHSTINKWEYDLREKLNSANRGLIENIQAYDTWLYGGNPIDAIDIDQYIDEIKKGVDTGLFEKYINEKFINNEILTILHKGVNDLNERKDEEILNKLREKRKNLSNEEYLLEEEKTKEFIKWQERENTKEELATIPTLDIKDLPEKFERIPRKLIEKDNVKYLLHDLNTNELKYIRLVFNANNFSKEELPYVSIVMELIGRLDTENYSYEELSQIENMYTGGVFFNHNFIRDYVSKEFNRYIILSTRLLDNYMEASKYILELLYKTKFDDKDRIKNILLMVKSRFESNILSNANVMMMRRAKSQISTEASYYEYTIGLEYFQKLSKIIENFDDNTIDKLNDIYIRLFSKDNLIVNITSENGKETMKDISYLIENIEDRKFNEVPIEFNKEDKAEAFIMNSDVQYVSKASSFDELNIDYRGNMKLLSKILSNSFLYQEVRAKEGAYGVGVNIDSENILKTYSYRDPNLRKTIETYKNMGNYIENINLSKEEFNSYIIGTIGNLEPVLSANQKANFDLNMFLQNKPYEILDKILQDIIYSEEKDIKGYSEILKKSMENRNLSVLGSKKTIEENKDLFDNIIYLK